ncbi:beta-carotene ketolase (CrtW type) [Pseudarcicella hirudinis]|uniref:Beta-carotene ketolase (CrtW type) n=1 Tax=Pseudarcicella hirudinis TaxID=1079859 RepID=A0A1I5YX94_9BACT|nr:fatty acid desaturase [Pseudarcicella hirudinis]SFQ48849.1 beta-carotene ketolase (CrtW type) [Pseudarcicella hirudinis]
MLLKDFKYKGIVIALSIIVSWGGSLIFLLHYKITFTDPLIYIFVLWQMHLYTGIFITAHDSIHGVVAPHNPKLNYWIGFFSATLFAFNNYKKLSVKHHLHHKHVVSKEDPDYYEGNFLKWWLKFAIEYVTIWQILLMAVTYNILKLYFPMENLILFWEIPAILSTLQLFYFGTYLPHRGEHAQEDVHKARSQKLNHFVAFFSCYFFGYHHEHHAFPYLPWWQLAEAREREEHRIQ